MSNLLWENKIELLILGIEPALFRCHLINILRLISPISLTFRYFDLPFDYFTYVITIPQHWISKLCKCLVMKVLFALWESWLCFSHSTAQLICAGSQSVSSWPTLLVCQETVWSFVYISASVTHRSTVVFIFTNILFTLNREILETTTMINVIKVDICCIRARGRWVLIWNTLLIWVKTIKSDFT